MKAIKTIAVATAIIGVAVVQAQQVLKTAKAGTYKVQFLGKQADLKVGDNRVFKVKITQPGRKAALLGYKLVAGTSMPDNPGVRMMPPTSSVDKKGVATITFAFPIAGKYELGLDITPPGKKTVYTKFNLIVKE